MSDSPLQLPPLSLYIHIPWCVRKCPYCDFNSHAASTKMPEQDYVLALVRDLKQDLPLVQNRPLQSIFFGGGTPSLFTSESIGKILREVEKLIPFSEDIEITLEANPGTFEQQKFEGYRQAGVNRLSLGVQSFTNSHLEKLGRIHSAEESLTAINAARSAGFNNFNIDLMHGLPGQTLQQALSDLEQAIALAPTHISWYQLTIEPNTAFYSSPPLLPMENILDDIQQQGHDLLEKAGYRQYEISAFSQPSNQSRHNLNYWQFGDYLGIGAGAHGKITVPENQHIIRINKTRLPADYLAREESYAAAQTTVSTTELPLEFMMNALRLSDGVPRHFFQQRTGLDFEAIATTWEKLQNKGLVMDTSGQLATTRKGLLFLDSILEQF